MWTKLHSSTNSEHHPPLSNYMPISSVWHPCTLYVRIIPNAIKLDQIIPKVTLQYAVSRWLMRFLIIAHRLECGRRRGSAPVEWFRRYRPELQAWISTRRVCPTPWRRTSSPPSPKTSITGNYVPFRKWGLSLSLWLRSTSASLTRWKRALKRGMNAFYGSIPMKTKDLMGNPLSERLL